MIDECPLHSAIHDALQGYPDPKHVKAIDAYWVTAAEHGMNASTFTRAGHRLNRRDVRRRCRARSAR